MIHRRKEVLYRTWVKLRAFQWENRAILASRSLGINPWFFKDRSLLLDVQKVCEQQLPTREKQLRIDNINPKQASFNSEKQPARSQNMLNQSQTKNTLNHKISAPNNHFLTLAFFTLFFTQKLFFSRFFSNLSFFSSLKFSLSKFISTIIQKFKN